MRLPIFAHTGPRHWGALVVVAAVLGALPLVLPDPFFILVLQSLAYLFIATLGLDILVGWTGQICSATRASTPSAPTRRRSRRRSSAGPSG